MIRHPFLDLPMPLADRRPLASRQTAWAKAAAQQLTRWHVSPNGISLASVGFAALGAWAIAMGAPLSSALLVAAVCVQLRLVCNLLDGMVAIEGGLKSKTGSFFNEAPDRLADGLLLVALGYATPDPWLGWLAALLAFGTAYLRALGASLGLGQDFQGPLAKPQRMAVLTGALVLGAIEPLISPSTTYALTLGAGVLVGGTAWTCVQRIRTLLRGLEAQP
jgi:phosphatidylglycerophosphate synthase